MTQSRVLERLSKSGIAKGAALCRGAGCPRKNLFSFFCSPPAAVSKKEKLGRSPKPQVKGCTLDYPA